MATDLSHVMMIEYTHQIGPYEEQEVALFNINHLSEEEARELILLEEYHKDLIRMSKRQFLSIFRNEDVCSAMEDYKNEQ